MALPVPANMPLCSSPMGRTTSGLCLAMPRHRQRSGTADDVLAVANGDASRWLPHASSGFRAALGPPFLAKSRVAHLRGWSGNLLKAFYFNALWPWFQAVSQAPRVVAAAGLLSIVLVGGHPSPQLRTGDVEPHSRIGDRLFSAGPAREPTGYMLPPDKSQAVHCALRDRGNRGDDPGANREDP